MTEPQFFPHPQGLTAQEIAALTGAVARGDVGERRITGIAPLDRAGPGDLAFMQNAKYADAFAATHAGLCLTTEKFAANAPRGVGVLVTPAPYRAFVTVAHKLFPARCGRPRCSRRAGLRPARWCIQRRGLRSGVTIDPGAVIGPRAEIGAGTIVGADAVIGPEVRIGRDCAIGAGCTDRACADRRPRRSSMPGRASGRTASAMSLGAARPRQGSAGRPGHHPGRCRDRRRHHDRPRRHPRYGDRRGHQNRQSGPDWAQCGDRPALRDRRAYRDLGQLHDRGLSSMLGGRVGITDNHVTIGDGRDARGGQRGRCRISRPAAWGGCRPSQPAREWLKANAALAPRETPAPKQQRPGAERMS